jgi:hypothetical protein
MDLDEQTKNEAAKWRAMRTAIEADVGKYEKQRKAWLAAVGLPATVDAEDQMNETARDVVGYLALALGVKS